MYIDIHLRPLLRTDTVFRALERVPSQIRAEGGVARMVSYTYRTMDSRILRRLLFVKSDPKMIKDIVDAVTIPVMAKVRIGHFVEAQVKQCRGTGSRSLRQF